MRCNLSSLASGNPVYSCVSFMLKLRSSAVKAIKVTKVNSFNYFYTDKTMAMLRVKWPAVAKFAVNRDLVMQCKYIC